MFDLTLRLNVSSSKVTNSDPTVKNYAFDLSKVVIVDKATERRLFRDYLDNGNIESRNKLIESGLRFVVKVAQKFSKDINHQKVLISAGNEGLLVAIERFDLNRGTRFLSYATWWVLLYIREEIHRQSVVSVPIWRKKTARKVKNIQNKLRDELGRDASDVEVQQASGLSLNQIKDVLNDQHSVVPLEGNEAELVAEDSVETQAVNRSADQLINYILMTLPVRERFILQAYYGFITDPAMSLKQVATILNISSERVRQIKIEALATFKKILAEYQVQTVSDMYQC